MHTLGKFWPIYLYEMSVKIGESEVLLPLWGWVEILLAINFIRIGQWKTYYNMYVSLVLLKGPSC